MNDAMIKGLYIMNKEQFDNVYSKENREAIEKHVSIYREPLTAEEIRTDLTILQEAEVLFCGWGAPLMDKDFLDNAPDLKAVFYGAGTVRSFVTPSFWKRGIKLTSAYGANAVPVAEFTMAQIILSLKKVWFQMNRIRESKTYHDRSPMFGAYRSTVGIVSLGMIGRKVLDLLKPFDLNIIAYDPFVSAEEEREKGIEMVSLEELFKRSHVISLHTPWLKETEGMIGGKLFSLMREDATFINTARGAVVNEREMIEVLKERSDITALLDVTYPEPPAKDSPLFHMDNVFLTPHIAGSMDGECGRMGRFMVEELQRYMAGEEFQWNITEEKAKILA